MTSVRVLDGAGDVAAAAWDALLPADASPFLEHAYVAAVEADSATPRHGVVPRHVTLWRGRELVAAMPLYLKLDGRGEFLYDHALAMLARRAGAAWYPKLVSMAPFAPFDVARLLVRPGEDALALGPALLDAADALAARLGASSINHLFVGEAEAALLEARGHVPRLGISLAWENQGWSSWEEYLARGLRSKDRVRTNRELRDLDAAGVTITRRSGAELGQGDLEAMFAFYEATCDAHGTGSDYLKRGTWERLWATWRERLVMLDARDPAGARVGGALLVEKGQDLYGRYWGAREQVPFLYFALCFYRPIQDALARGLRRVHGGAGTTYHKHARGLDPRPARSLHRAFDSRLSDLLGQYLEREREEATQGMEALRAQSHVRRTPDAEDAGSAGQGPRSRA